MAATESKKMNSENPAAAKTGGKVWFYSLLLTLQYGAQPLISKRFVRREVIVTSSVLTCEAVKVICALVLMAKEGTLKKNYREWTLFGSLTASGLPAAIYALQNSLLQISYKNLDSLTFSILNQTKLFFTALFTYIILRWSKDSDWESRLVPADTEWKKVVLPSMKKYSEATDGSSIEQKESALVWHHLEADPDFGIWQAKELLDHLESVLANEHVVVKRGQHIVVVKPQNVNKGSFGSNVGSIAVGSATDGTEKQKQSIQQIGALFLLIMAAVLLSVGEGSSKASSSSNPDEILFYGIVPVLVASVLSGMASALCQWASQVKKHSSYLMTVEMSIIGSLCLISSTSKSPDGEAIRQHGFFYGWTALTLIPVILNAVGGILVGLVTSYAGGVRKGFVIVSALLVTALLQFIFDGKLPSPYCLVALPLVMISISIYQKYPYHVKKKQM